MSNVSVACGSAVLSTVVIPCCSSEFTHIIMMALLSDITSQSFGAHELVSVHYPSITNY